MTANNSNQPTNFNFNGLTLRVIEGSDGEPWFLAGDICKLLDLRQRSWAYARLSDVEKTYVGRTNLGLNPGKPMLLVSESGLYKLVLRSDKPEAKQFQDWVAGTVLPAIRKDGGYVQAVQSPSSTSRTASPTPTAGTWRTSSGRSISTSSETSAKRCVQIWTQRSSTGCSIRPPIRMPPVAPSVQRT